MDRAASAPHYERAWRYLASGLLAVLVLSVTESDVVLLLAIGLLAIGLTFLYRPSIERVSNVLTERGGLAVLGLSAAHAVVLIGVIEALFFKPAFPSYADRTMLIESQIGWLLTLLLSMLTLLPFGIQLLHNHARPGRRAPAWPAAAGLSSGLTAGLALFVAWEGLGKWIVRMMTTTNIEQLALAILVLGIAGLFLGIAGALWWRAARATDDDRYDGRGIFGHAMTGTAIGVGGGALLTARLWAVPSTSIDALGLGLAAVLTIVVGAAWGLAAWRLRGCEPRSGWHAAAAIAAFIPPYALSLVIAGAIAGAGGWAIFAAVIAVPVSLAMAGLITAFAAPTAKRILG